MPHRSRVPAAGQRSKQRGRGRRPPLGAGRGTGESRRERLQKAAATSRLGTVYSPPLPPPMGQGRQNLGLSLGPGWATHYSQRHAPRTPSPASPACRTPRRSVGFPPIRRRMARPPGWSAVPSCRRIPLDAARGRRDTCPGLGGGEGRDGSGGGRGGMRAVAMGLRVSVALRSGLE